LKYSYFFKLSASVLDVSPIMGATALLLSDVGGGVILSVVLSELVELSLLFPQDVKTHIVAIINTILFIMDLSFRWMDVV